MAVVYIRTVCIYVWMYICGDTGTHSLTHVPYSLTHPWHVLLFLAMHTASSPSLSTAFPASPSRTTKRNTYNKWGRLLEISTIWDNRIFTSLYTTPPSHMKWPIDLHSSTPRNTLGWWFIHNTTEEHLGLNKSSSPHCRLSLVSFKLNLNTRPIF